MKNWEAQIELPQKEADVEYGYLLKSDQQPVTCDRETLLELIENEKDIQYVTTPQHDTYIIPGSDYETLQPILKKRKSKSKRELYWGLFAVVVWGGLVLLEYSTSNADTRRASFTRLSLMIFGVIPVLSALYQLFTIKRVNESNYHRESSELTFAFWIDQEKVVSIYVVTGVLLLIALIQLILGVGDTVEVAGLVKPAARAGEYWRLLTCTLLHGGIVHILFNGVAIFAIGHLVIRITGFSYFIIVFLASGILGSVVSLLFLPDLPSVGASGGIMGLIGFLLIIGIRHMDTIPRNFYKSMLRSIGFVALVGLYSMDIIDNAAHAGGAIGGIVLGFLLIEKKENMIPITPSIAMNIMGIISTAILLAGIVLIAVQLSTLTG